MVVTVCFALKNRIFLIDYSGCNTPNKCFLGDGICDETDGTIYLNFGHNTPECNFDGGDCVCHNAKVPFFPNHGFDYSGCNVDDPCKLRDRLCQWQDPAYNTPECNFDDGDCLVENNGYNFPKDDFDNNQCVTYAFI